MSGLAANVAQAPASPAAPEHSVQEEWIQEFFDAHNIVHTLQSLLRGGGRTVADLCKMCIAAHASDLVPALTPEGLMPFSNNYGYVFRYADMTRKQIKALLAVIDSSGRGSRAPASQHHVGQHYQCPRRRVYSPLSQLPSGRYSLQL